MVTYQKYAEYKDSGVEWLGDVPKHWLITTFKRVIKEHSGNGFPIELQGDESGVIPFLKVSDINGTNKYSDRCNNRISNDSLNKYGWNLVPRGSIVTGKIGEALRKNHRKILSEDSVIDNNCIGIEPIHLTENYNFYVHKVIDFDWYVNGGAIPSISVQKYKAEVIAIPNENEQTQIANFLDHETAKIDNLITKQERLIELLKEKRQAVISHAVTKGLNPDVAMKDSGVEWLGQVPEHWTVSKFGYISQVVRGGSPRPAGDPTLFNGDYSPWVTVAEITKDDELYLTSTETFLTKKGSEQCRVFQAGTLLLSNSGATLGVPKILCINANANDGVVGFEDLRIDTEYAYFYLSVLTNDLRERVKQGSGQPNLNTDIVKAISITIPPVNEIKEIVADIKKKIDHFAKLMKSAENAIQLMQERRTALISAAVTGKIDVRNWQNPNNNNEAKMESGA